MRQYPYLDYQGGMPTPWGRANLVYHLADGVLWVSTPSHGGLMVGKGVARAKLTPRARMVGTVWANYYTFEEDCQYAVCFLERLEWHRAMYVADGRPAPEDTNRHEETVRRWEPGYFDATETEVQAFLELERKRDHPQVGDVLRLNSNSVPTITVTSVRPLRGATDAGGRYRIPANMIIG